MENAGVFWVQKRLSSPHRQSSMSVDWLSGAFLLVRREVFDQVGGFDERFFLYAEETDWQRRIRNAKWEIDWVPEARVVHFGGASGGGIPAKGREFFF